MKDTKGSPTTEEEFMKDIGHGVVTQDWKEKCTYCHQFYETKFMEETPFHGWVCNTCFTTCHRYRND